MAVVIVTIVLSAGDVKAAPSAWEPALEWEPIGLTGRVTELFTPSSGAFFAVQRRLGSREIAPTSGIQGDEGFWRSDDAGKSWRRIGLPPRADRVWVDPTDHSIIYAHAQPRLHKSTDGGESWTPLVLTPFPETDSEVYVGLLAISPADPQLLQALAWNGSTRHLLRSRDGGLSWESTVQELGPPPCCPPRTSHILPHPTDAARVLRVAGEYVASTFVADVEVSDDQATSWERRGRPEIEGLATGISDLVGFTGSRPERLYAVTRTREVIGPGRVNRPIGGSAFRSDDEARTWTRILSAERPGEEVKEPTITGLAYDPRYPDFVYVALENGVLQSADAGRTWSQLGRQDLPRITALAFGIDGRYLFAATEAGLFRINPPV